MYLLLEYVVLCKAQRKLTSTWKDRITKTYKQKLYSVDKSLKDYPALRTVFAPCYYTYMCDIYLLNLNDSNGF
jgi:hypothetical protein